MRLLTAPVVAAFLLLSGCAAAPADPVVVLTDPQTRPFGWRGIASAVDRERLDRLGEAWAEALRRLRSRGFGARLAGEGELLDPQAALPRAAPPPGPYRCRLIRLGPGRRPLIAYRAYFCHVVVEGELMSLTKEEGSERPGGYLWPDSDSRLVFLGAVALGRERLPPAYGEQEDRDLIGLVERIGPFRYRLVMPYPPSGATLDLLELVPFVPEEAPEP